MSEELKDDKLYILAIGGCCSIARFISISPEKELRYVCIKENYDCSASLKQILLDLIEASKSKSINIRSFSIEKTKGNPVIFNKKAEDIEEILAILEQNRKENKYSIVNENININDGGVSGVTMGNVVEFAPNDTPKCVDKPDVCHLPKELAMYMFKTVYGFAPKDIFPTDDFRIEFSLHPSREGLSDENIIAWEYERVTTPIPNNPKINFPNRFSKHIGDKVFGLIVADYLGYKVPYTTVICRNVAPFSFGTETNSGEKWIRTAPITKQSGQFYSGDKWIDPFKLMNEEEQKGDEEINIASILSQDAVKAEYSGAMIITEKETIIEGVKGKGDKFMLGQEAPQELLECKLIKLLEELEEFSKSNLEILGDFSLEWVFDGYKVWVVQLNQLKHSSSGSIIVEGNPDTYEKFYTEDGLDKLREKIKSLENRKEKVGIELIGDVGICSHFGDLLRLAEIPSYLTKTQVKNE